MARGTSSALLQLTSALLNRTANQPGGVSLSQRPIGQQFLGTSETVASTACCVTPWRIRWQWLIHCQARAQWCVNDWVQLEGRWAVPHSVSGTSLSASMNGSACAVGQNIKDLVRAIMIMTMSLLACCYDCEHRIATASSHAPSQAQDYPGIVERWSRMQIPQGVTLVSRSTVVFTRVTQCAAAWRRLSTGYRALHHDIVLPARVRKFRSLLPRRQLVTFTATHLPAHAPPR